MRKSKKISTETAKLKIENYQVWRTKSYLSENISETTDGKIRMKQSEATQTIRPEQKGGRGPGHHRNELCLKGHHDALRGPQLKVCDARVLVS